MADFYPLVSRTIAGLPENTPEARTRVYEKAREALLRHLRGMDPPLPESEIVRQRLALDESINRMERELAANTALADVMSAEQAPASRGAMQATLRPRVATRDETEARRGGDWRSWLIGFVVVVATGGVGVLAWTLRDDPKRYQPGVEAEAPPTDAPSPADKPKVSVRIGDSAPPPATPPQASKVDNGPPADKPDATAPAAPGPSPATPGPPVAAADAVNPVPDTPLVATTVAQKATLIRAADDRTKPPEVTAGRAVWQRIDSSPGEGRPVEPAIRIEFSFEQAEISGTILLRRNSDAALPASHTLEIVFTPKPGGDPVTEIQLPQFKDEETVRGAPIFGLPFPVGENLFVIALSNLPRDVSRNVEMLAKKGWFDLPFRHKNGKQALMTVERGISGERAMNEALEAWARKP